MKAKILRPVHESYKRHRSEFAWQIIFPVVMASFLVIGLIVLINISTFQQGGDVGRWAAISTIWIVIPIMVAMLIFVAVLGVIIFYLGKLLNITPTYTGIAQDYVYKVAAYIKRGADMAVKPVLFLDGVTASIKRFFRTK